MKQVSLRWHVLAALAIVLGAVVLAGCARQSGAASSSAPAATRASASSVSSGQLAQARAMALSGAPFPLRYREYRLSGSVEVPDMCDDLAVLQRNGGLSDVFSLLDLENGRQRVVMREANSGARRWWASTARVSDGWLAWEEIERGDDLASEKRWRLFAAKIDRETLSIGQPFLVATSQNTAVMRPLFDLSGDRLLWLRVAATQPAGGVESQLVEHDLAGDRKPRTLYRSAKQITVCGYSDQGATVLFTESQSPAGPERIVRIDAAGKQQGGEIRVPAKYSLSHWPAARDGRVAWAPFMSAQAGYPYLFVRDASGRVQKDALPALDPCFVGDYMFYNRQILKPSANPANFEVRALRLSDGKSDLVADDRSGIWWSGVGSDPDLQKRFIVYGDNMNTAKSERDWRSIVRVYEVK